MGPTIQSLEAAIIARLASDGKSPVLDEERVWRIEARPGCGRCLVAAHDLAAGTIVFSETPLIVATNGDMESLADDIVPACAAVAVELLREPLDSPAHLLQDAVDAADAADGELAVGCMSKWMLEIQRVLNSQHITHTDEAVRWAIGVASTNTHGTNSEPARGVLGLLASMMEHNCAPSTYTDVASAAEGSVVTLRTKRHVRAGECLSISYVLRDLPVHERRRRLRLQHGFVCVCERCVAEMAAAGETSEGEHWRQAWEDRAYLGLDPYTGEMIG